MKYAGLILVVLIAGCTRSRLHQQPDRQEQAAQAATQEPPEHSTRSHAAGMPMPRITLGDEGIQVPFYLDDEFAVPQVEIMLNGKGPYRFALDTGMSGTVMIRPQLAKALGFPVVGKAIVGDGSGKHNQAADLVMIPGMNLDGMQMTDVIAVAPQAIEAHLKEVPETLVGILGRALVQDYLLTIDYPGQTIAITPGQLSAEGDHVIGFDYSRGVMQVSANLSGKSYLLFVDTGSRSSITLPRSAADRLQLATSLKESRPVATTTNTYQILTAVLGGTLELAGHEIENPAVMFADEHTPQLLGYQILRKFALTIDQRLQLIRFDG